MASKKALFIVKGPEKSSWFPSIPYLSFAYKDTYPVSSILCFLEARDKIILPIIPIGMKHNTADQGIKSNREENMPRTWIDTTPKRYTSGQYTCENMLNITSRQGNANQSHMWQHFVLTRKATVKTKKQTSIAEMGRN